MRSLQPWHFLLTRINEYSGCGFAFPTCMSSASTTIWRLTDQLICLHGILHNVETWFTAQGLVPWDPMVLFHIAPPRGCWPDRTMQQLFEGTVETPDWWWCFLSMVYHSLRPSKVYTYNTGDVETQTRGLDPWVRKIPGRENGKPLQYSCLENSMDRGALAGYSPWGHRESDRAERLTLSLSIPEGKTHPKASLAHFTSWGD